MVWAQYFIEILIFCVKSHGFRVRQFLIQNKVFFFIMKPLKLKRKSLNLAIIKLFKAVLSSNDDILSKYIHSNGFILELSELLFEKRGRFNKGNLIFSCILELFDIIYRQNLKKFIKSICENDSFRQKVGQNQDLKVFFERIFQRYEQYKEEDPFNSIKPGNNNITNEDENNNKEINEKHSKENKNLEELAYFENDANEANAEKNEVFNKEELKEKKEHLLVLQNKIKRKLEKPEDEGLVMKKVNLGSENNKKINFGTKIDIVFQEKGI